MFRILFLSFFCSNILFAKQSVIIDTDVGYDDLMAIMSLVSKPEVDVKAITISGTGLAHPKKGLENIRQLLALFNKNISTAYGRENPFEGGHLFPDEWRKSVDDISENIKGFTSREYQSSYECNAVELLATIMKSSSEKNIILALAPLTNLADLFLKHPDFTQKVDRIYIMGGAFNVPGNLSIIKESVAEWNIFADPVAAKAVIQTGIPIYFIPLDATNYVPLTMSFYEDVKKMQIGSRKGEFFLSLLNGVLPWIALDGFYFWDVVAAEILFDPSLAYFESHKIDIITASGPDSGKTFFSENGFPVQIAMKVDAKKLLQAFCDTIKYSTEIWGTDGTVIN